MRERAESLTGLPDAENPRYDSSLTWHPMVGIERARAYYAWRLEHVQPDGQSVEARVDAAARRAFYGHALREMKGARYSEENGRVECVLPRLPGNTAEARETGLYTDSAWPTTWEDAGQTLHFAESCPGASGAPGPSAALSAIDSGAVRECPVCRMGIDDVGRAPAASTSIPNGFEYHLRAFMGALDGYARSRTEELALEREARASAESAGDAFEEAMDGLVAKRPRIAPPGRNGCVALVAGGGAATPDELQGEFAPGIELGARGAVSAAALARDPSTRENNVLSAFFARIEERAGGAAGLLDAVMDLWGDLLVSYGDVGARLEGVVDGLLGDLSMGGGGSVAEWLNDRVDAVMRGLGIEPVDLSLRKPVLVDSSKVLERSGLGGLGDVQSALRSLEPGSSDPRAILDAIGYEAGEYIASMEFTIAEIPLPGGGKVPLTVRLRDLLGAGGGGDGDGGA